MCTLFDVNYLPKCGMWKVNFHPRLYSAANVFGSCSVFGHFPFSFVFRKMKHMLSWIQVRRLTWPLHNIWLLCLEKLFSWSNWLKMSSSSECLKKNVRIHPAALISSRIMKKCKASHAHYMEQLSRQMFFHIVSNPLRRCLETKRWELCASCNIHGPDWNDCGCPPFRIKSWVCLKTNKKIKRDSQCLHCEVGCVVIFFPDVLGKPSGLTIISGVHTYQKSGRDTWLFEDILFWLACAALVIWISTTRLQEK